MPSLVTSVIGGVQGASAAHNAADAQKRGYQQARDTVNQAVANANPILQNASDAASKGATDAASTAGTGVTNAATTAGAGVTGAAGDANAKLDPYAAAGSSAATKLGNMAGTFSFNPTDLQNDPGYQFQLQQGMKGLNNSLAARGIGTSGAALKAAANYSQGLAGTTYNNAYQRALGTYQTNISSLGGVANMGMAAAGTQGSNLMNAAAYAGNTGMAGAEYAGNANINAAQYTGNAGMWSGGQQASNLVNAGVYSGNTQIGAGNAEAQGDMGAANAWNSMLGGIGSAANAAFMGGFSPTGGGWSFGNMGQNMGKMAGASMYATPASKGYAPPAGS